MFPTGDGWRDGRSVQRASAEAPAVLNGTRLLRQALVRAGYGTSGSVDSSTGSDTGVNGWSGHCGTPRRGGRSTTPTPTAEDISGPEAFPGERQAHLSSDMDFYFTDRSGAGWDCGYRNLQMLGSALMSAWDAPRITRSAVFFGAKAVPSIEALQQQLEWAWENGFDPVGAEHFGGRLVGRRAWIGAADVTALLRSYRLRAQVVLFDQAQNGRCGDGEALHPELFEWVWSYYTQWCRGGVGCLRCRGEECLCVDALAADAVGDAAGTRLVPPLFLQHDGHSRTIVGVMRESYDAPVELLVVDPSQALQPHAFNAASVLSRLRYRLDELTRTQYQILYLERNLYEHDSGLFEQLKIF